MDIQEQLRFWFDAISLKDRMDLYQHWTEQQQVDSIVHKILYSNGLVDKEGFVKEKDRND
jgi:hypothetical protein